jgi:hypothetical protein
LYEEIEEPFERELWREYDGRGDFLYRGFVTIGEE